MNVCFDPSCKVEVKLRLPPTSNSLPGWPLLLSATLAGKLGVKISVPPEPFDLERPPKGV